MAARTVIPWMPVSGDLPTHPKSIALEVATGLPRAWTHPLELWLWCLSNRPNGFIGDLTPLLVAKYSGVPKAKAQAYADALRSDASLFIDADGRIHGWDDYAGAYLRRREGNRDRQTRRRHGGNGSDGGATPVTVTRDTPVTSRVTSRPSHGPRGEESKRREEVQDQEPSPSPPAPSRVEPEQTPLLTVLPGEGVKPEPKPPFVGPAVPEKPPKPRERNPDMDAWAKAYCEKRAVSFEDFKWDKASVTLFQKALKDYGITKLLQAIDGCAREAFYLRSGPLVWLSTNAVIAGLGSPSQGPPTVRSAPSSRSSAGSVNAPYQDQIERDRAALGLGGNHAG